MFSHVYQSGYLSLFYSQGTQPLGLWRCVGTPKLFVQDDIIQSQVLVLDGSHPSQTFVTCPSQANLELDIRLVYLVLVVRHLQQPFSLEVHIRDHKGILRRIRTSTYQQSAKVTNDICLIPLRLDPDWNQLRLDLADITRKAYGTNYTSCARIFIHAHCRLQRVYFVDRLVSEDNLPAEFKLLKSIPTTDVDTPES